MSIQVSFNNKETFSPFEKMSIRFLLTNNLSYAPFYALWSKSTCINVLKNFHQDDGETYPHFNINFYNHHTGEASFTYHVYVDLTIEKIKKITFISSL